VEAASVPAEGAQGAEDGAQEGQEQGQQQGGVDLAPLMEHMDQRFERGFEDLAERFQGPDDGEQDPYASGYGEPEYDLGQEAEGLYDETGEVDPEAAQQFLGQLIDQRAGQLMEQQLGPVMDTLGELRNAHNASALVAQHPEIQDQAVAEDLMNRATQAAFSLGVGEEDASVLVQNPAFLELVLQAGKAEQAARGEPAEGRSELDLESGATAGQGQSPQEIGRGIVAAGGSQSFWTGG
jgi:hypothetical protein